MKLRLHGNSVRLRLSQKDVAALESAQTVEETVTFPGGASLSYLIEQAGEEVSAAFEGSRIVIRVPRGLIVSWAASGEVGIEARSGALNVLIEKDFKCIHRDSPEDAESFPNPADRVRT